MSNKQLLFEIWIIKCNIRNAFTATFDQFTASLMNKSDTKYCNDKTITDSNVYLTVVTL